jgi:signal transduction histidine kinase
MGGQLTIDSQEGVGSKFCCHLPFTIPDEDLAGQA